MGAAILESRDRPPLRYFRLLDAVLIPQQTFTYISDAKIDYGCIPPPLSYHNKIKAMSVS